MKVDSPPREVVGRADAGEEAVDDADLARAAAGTKLPICASSVMSATWRRYVDFPAMLGPVMIRIGGRRGSRRQSLATNPSRPATASTTGWRPSVMAMWRWRPT